MKNLKKLVKAQKEYIEFLGKCINDTAVYLHVHNMIPSDEVIKEGELLRAKIKDLS